MRRISFLFVIALIVASYVWAQAKKDEMPKGLQEAYDAFAKAMKSGNVVDINKYCLPNAIAFTYGQRKDPESGQDINIPFAKSSFSDSISSVRKDGDDCYLVRTNTTALWFVEAKTMGWKLYRYLDKPIQ